ncbi:hypothetical protein [Micromonospora sp. WMMD710]|uniref:HNH endonuclease n=1 Tax=Micromonospora sp. WMMD710 TaxID=3016085 RepID=UPI0024177F7E|nr:hypothetical protein [Micromonospora sp. WMMD710]MDG4756295.1 hypothetical protein [Micromonospora sp. WMMD710]MDG4762438.1 hypothetical protein [Micromonospora sp. WMMD710]MDG4762473.1 hypothetical protein [Micromonospora sp. WMMD710]
MAWLKSSDSSNQHPAVLAPLAWEKGPDDDLDGWDLRLPAVAGIAWLCATYSADQTTDYVVPAATVALYGGPQWRRLAEWATRAGIWTPLADGSYLLADDSEHLFHIRLKAELEWERNRKNDNGNPALTIPVRLRDGDACRYCGRVVNWDARKGGLAGTYDHRNPGRSAAGPDDLVVACNQCNGRRGKDSHPERWQLLPTPAKPYYGQITVTHLAKHGYDVPLSSGKRPTGLPGGPRIDEARPDDQPDPALQQHPRRPGTRPDHDDQGDPAPGRTTPTRRERAASRPQPSATPTEGHRARTVSATPPPGHRAHTTTSATPAKGHRASRDRAAGPTPRNPTQDQQVRGKPIGRSSADPAEPKPPGSGKPGSGRDGSGAPPRPAQTNRKRGRRAPRSRPAPPRTPPENPSQP